MGCACCNDEHQIVTEAIDVCQDVMQNLPHQAIVSYKLLASAKDHLDWGMAGTACGSCCWKCCQGCMCCCPAAFVHQGRLDMEVASQSLAQEVGYGSASSRVKFAAKELAKIDPINNEHPVVDSWATGSLTWSESSRRVGVDGLLFSLFTPTAKLKVPEKAAKATAEVQTRSVRTVCVKDEWRYVSVSEPTKDML
eukprot:gene1095-1032_t